MKTNKLLIFILISIMICISFTACISNKKSDISTRTEFLMDTVITLKIYDGQNEKAIDEAINRLKEIENRMSKTIDTSDISLINENAGIKPVKVNEDVYYVIEKAKYFAEISEGAYEPTIGPLVELWNINVTDEERQSIPSNREIEEKKALVNYKDLILMEDNQVYLNRKGMKLDLGGIVKGYAADEVKRIFLKNGVESAIIDLGGNIYVLGENPNGEYWKIGVQDPFTLKENYIGILNVRDSSIVTSGDYERFFLYKGERYHHIIDAKTGYPSKTEIKAVSVISEKSIDGDALSTALFVMGVEEGSKLIKNLENIDAIFITKKKGVIIPEKLKDFFTLSDDDLEIIINSYY